MKTDNIYLQLALDQLASIYQSENLMADYLQVLKDKAISDELKRQIHWQIHLLQERKEEFMILLAGFGCDLKGKSCEGIRGIISNGLQFLDTYKGNDPENVVLVHSLWLIHHYISGTYKSIAYHLRLAGFSPEVNFMNKCIHEEKKILQDLHHLNVANFQLVEV